MAAREPICPSALTREHDIVTVEVGKEAKTYCIHKPLLLRQSGHFLRALAGRREKEGDSKCTLKDVVPQIFDEFVDWLCTNELPQDEEGWLETCKDSSWNDLHIHGFELLGTVLPSSDQCISELRILIDPAEVLALIYATDFLVRIMIRCGNIENKRVNAEDLKACAYHEHATELEKEECIKSNGSGTKERKILK
ncbi:hypothetical protein K458DRAFT_382416 [Lentithecium fluviatile CBS 122367]|uniref:BTB domain-containing protein n=1 Tax=Lentithecium fluviatile CBS 122367 TaxID=1168545 RepID=A0A6G1JKT3_9PLEO|nr:hypothetical protein K458DRAFT_382416 [Lentithecium fluviatile CBS 122367]